MHAWRSLCRAIPCDSAAHALEDAPTHQTDGTAHHLGEQHHQQIAETTHDGMQLGRHGISGLEHEGDQLLQGAQLAELPIARFAQIDTGDGAGLQLIERTAALIDLNRPHHPAAPALLGIELIAQPFEIAGGEQVGAQQIAAQLGPLGAGGQHLGADSLGIADQPVGQQQLEIQQRLGFIRRQQTALHQQRGGLHQGGEHGLGIGKFRLGLSQITGVSTPSRGSCT